MKKFIKQYIIMEVIEGFFDGTDKWNEGTEYHNARLFDSEEDAEKYLHAFSNNVQKPFYTGNVIIITPLYLS